MPQDNLLRIEPLLGVAQHVAHPADRRDGAGRAAREVLIVGHQDQEVGPGGQVAVGERARPAGVDIARLGRDGHRHQLVDWPSCPGTAPCMKAVRNGPSSGVIPSKSMVMPS